MKQIDKQNTTSYENELWSLGYLEQCLQKESSITFDLPGQWEQEDCRRAAVLIPFLEHNDEWHLLFIRRAEHDHDDHSGQVAFAGGKYEPDDKNLLATALREAEEEIGLNPSDVTVLGQLNQHHSISRFSITPVVGHIPWPYKFELDDKEVARVFTIPLNWLMDPDNRRIEKRRLNNSEAIPVVYFDQYDGEVLWGASARMTLSLIALLNN